MHVNLRKTMYFVGLCSFIGLAAPQTAMATPESNSVSEVQQTKKVTGRVSDS